MTHPKLRSKILIAANVTAALTWLALSFSCGSGVNSGTAQNYPLIKPPVQASTPVGFGGGTSTAMSLQSFVHPPFQAFALDPADFKSRFFTTGPTNVFTILQSIDDRISGYNTRGGTSACLTQTPVAYTISAFGTSVSMFAQCYETIGSGFTGDPGFIQWGVKDSVFYLYTAIGAGWTAAIATPISGSTQYSVQAYSSVGIGNGIGTTGGGCGTSWDGCSYGVMQLAGNPVTQTFEMSVAGIGIGYCGAQYKSDGTNIYGTGSTDMGATCNTTDTICVKASDASTAATCTTAQQTFTLPAMGRTGGAGIAQATWGASAYPGSTSNTVTLNGTATDAAHFGPITPTSGVGAY